MSDLTEKIGELNALATELKDFSQKKFTEIDEKGAAHGVTLEKQESMLEAFDKKFTAIEKRIARSTSVSDEKNDVNIEMKAVNDQLRSEKREEIADIDQFMEIKSLVGKALRLGDKTITADEFKSINGVIDPDGGYLVAHDPLRHRQLLHS